MFITFYKFYATEARMNPKQIQEDFAQSGLSSYGERAKQVAENKGNLILDMKYFARPNDDVDAMLFEYVNYCRHMFQMPEMSNYGELYAFYLNRALELTELDEPQDLERLKQEMEKYNLLDFARQFHRIIKK